MTNARTARTAREKSAQLRAAAARRDSRRRNLLVLSAVLAVLVVAVGATVLIRTLDGAQQARTSSVPRNLTDGGFSVGAQDATAVIEIFEDFQCPACKEFEQANAEQLAGWAADGTARVVYRPVSILDRYSSTEYSTRAMTAAAAVIDASPDAFARFHDLLFANQPKENGPGLTDGQLVELAQQAGASTGAVQTALSTRSYDGWVAERTEYFSTQGHTGTPTVLVNGTPLQDWSPQALATAVKAAQG